MSQVVKMGATIAFGAGRAKGERLLLATKAALGVEDRKSTRLNSSHSQISYAVFCLKKKKIRSLGPASTGCRAVQGWGFPTRSGGPPGATGPACPSQHRSIAAGHAGAKRRDGGTGRG